MRRKNDDDTDLSDMHSGARGGKITKIQYTEICAPTISRKGAITVKFNTLSAVESGNRFRTKAQRRILTMLEVKALIGALESSENKKNENGRIIRPKGLPFGVSKGDLLNVFNRMRMMADTHAKAQAARTQKKLAAKMPRRTR